jgi:hypothetical protein
VDELGIEPSASLQELERAILEHDPSLKPGGAAVIAAAQPLQQAIVVVVRDDARAGDLLSIAEPLTHRSERELLLVRLLAPDADQAARSRGRRSWFNRFSASRQSPCSCRRERKAFSTRRRTHASSSSASPSAGEAKGSGTSAPPSPPARACRRCSFAAESARAGWRRARR